jgi:hypothetical protein
VSRRASSQAPIIEVQNANRSAELWATSAFCVISQPGMPTTPATMFSSENARVEACG